MQLINVSDMKRVDKNKTISTTLLSSQQAFSGFLIPGLLYVASALVS